VCAVFKVEGKLFRPGREVTAIAAEGPVERIWAGFARSEILQWWVDRGGKLLDIPATEFAERSDRTGELVWDRVPEGLVLRALLDRQSSHELIKIVTRAATAEEIEKFQHDRMPLLEKPLHASSPPPSPPVPPAPVREKPEPAPPKKIPPKSPAMVQEMLFDF
jgi:hypothetical protein